MPYLEMNSIKWDRVSELGMNHLTDLLPIIDIMNTTHFYLSIWIIDLSSPLHNLLIHSFLILNVLNPQVLYFIYEFNAKNILILTHTTSLYLKTKIGSRKRNATFISVPILKFLYHIKWIFFCQTVRFWNGIYCHWMILIKKIWIGGH